MAISVFPAPATGGSSVAAFAASIAAKNTTYVHTSNFEAGVYTLTCAPTSTDVTAVFVDGSSVLSTQVTTSGTISFTLATSATKVTITAKNNATVFPTIVTIEKTANQLTSVDAGSGTLDTINATGTYNQTGVLSVLAISGGFCGAPGGVGYVGGAAGGAPGNIAMGVVVTNAPTTVTVGAKGVARNTIGGSDTAPTNSSFGNLVDSTNTSSFITRGAGGGGGGVNTPGGSGTANQTFVSWNTTGTSGGGGGSAGIGVGSAENARGAGGGSGIGTGGRGGNGNSGTNTGTPITAGGDATGKGAGGGAGPTVGNGAANDPLRLGGDGSDGVVYVLRGF